MMLLTFLLGVTVGLMGPIGGLQQYKTKTKKTTQKITSNLRKTKSSYHNLRLRSSFPETKQVSMYLALMSP